METTVIRKLRATAKRRREKLPPFATPKKLKLMSAAASSEGSTSEFLPHPPGFPIPKYQQPFFPFAKPPPDFSPPLDYTPTPPPRFSVPEPDYTPATPPPRFSVPEPEYTPTTPPRFSVPEPEYTPTTPPRFSGPEPPEYTPTTPPIFSVPEPYYTPTTPPRFSVPEPEYTPTTPAGFSMSDCMPLDPQGFRKPSYAPFGRPTQPSEYGPSYDPEFLSPSLERTPPTSARHWPSPTSSCGSNFTP